MFNFKRFSAKHYNVNINGREKSLNEQEIGELIKEKLRASPVIQSTFKKFEVGLDNLQNLNIQIIPLKKEYAETNGDTMKLNPTLFEDGDFLNKYFFVVAHEIIHWLTRIKEKRSYFNDPEECDGFILSIAYELERGRDLDSIWNLIYPKISFHFHNEVDARNFFDKMIEKAHKLL